MKVKRYLVVCALGFILLIGACMDKHKNSLADIDKAEMEIETKNNCALCGSRDDSLMDYYRRFDSLGVICMNTWGISDSKVRCYDEVTGKERLYQSGSFTMINSYGEEECQFVIRGMYDRGIAEVDVHYGEKSVLDWESLTERLCTSCLDKIGRITAENAEMGIHESKDVCLVDFKTGEIYSLEDFHTMYMIRDYYVLIEHRKGSDHITIFYAPERR